VQGERFQSRSEVKINALRALTVLFSRVDAKSMLFNARWSDTNQDGMLQRSELKNVMDHIGFPLSDAEVEEVFDLVDLDRDKGITKEEFLAQFDIKQDHWKERLISETKAVQDAAQTDHEPIPITATDWIAKKSAAIGKHDIAIHPNSTHLLFWDLPGTNRSQSASSQSLPWTEIDKFHEYLLDAGVMQGCLVCNGDQSDLNDAMSAVAQSTPVISLKSVGGASEFLSELFEKRVEGGPDDAGRQQGFAPRYPPDAIQLEFRSNKNTLPKDSDECEMIVVDCVNPDVGKVLQKQMADMLTMQDSAEEKMIGFQASERERLVKAWTWSLMYVQNSNIEKLKSDILSYVIIVLQLVVVVVIVYKTQQFGSGGSSDAEEEDPSQARRMLQIAADGEGVCPSTCYVHLEEEEELQAAATTSKSSLEESLGFALIVIPIVSGILLTFVNAFQPLQKYNALRWAAFACEAEIYTYRARAKAYSASAAAAREWEFDDEDKKAVDMAAIAKSKPSKHFVEKMNGISETVMSTH
jgi:hypothetical protein